MPFTISHTAAVLPFSRWLGRHHLLSAVCIGSMAPDFGMFVPWHIERVQTHSVWALLYFSLPVGMLAYCMFQYVIKTPLVELLPDGAYIRWRPYERPADIKSALQWLRVAVGVVAGAITHLVWDGFTHEGARGVRMIPALGGPVVEIGGHRLAGARLLQDVSSLLGLVVLALLLCYALRPARGVTAPPRRIEANARHRWVFGYVIATAACAVGLYAVARLTQGWGNSLNPRLVQMAFASVRGSALALLVVSLLLQRRLGAYR